MLKLFATSAVFVALAYGSLFGLQEVQGNHVTASQRPPYQASLAFYHKKNNTYQHWCSGSIISNEWIVTAGSCFDIRLWPNKNASLVIRIDGNPLETNTTHLHQEINEPTYYIWYFLNQLTKMAVNDIILVRVPKPFEFDVNLQPIQLWNQGQICAVYDGNEPCPIQADPGSPLTINGRLAGILSWGSNPCAPREEASVYAEVGYFRNWIKNETGI